MKLEVEGVRQRRVCSVLGASKVLSSFDTANEAVTAKHHQSSKRIADQGINYLKSLGAKRLSGANSKRSTGGFPQCTFEPNPSLLVAKEPLLEQVSNLPTPHKETPHFSFGNTEQKTHKEELEVQAPKDVDFLSKSLKKLGLSDDDEPEVEYFEDEDKMAELKGKSLTQIIMESRAKSARQRAQRSEDSDSDESYPMTEYSSNDSSNNHSYEEHRCTVGDTMSDLNKFTSYSKESILDSPKKSKSCAKANRRIFIRDKWVPRWAESLQMVAEETARQKWEGKLRPAEVYGECLIERLNSNVIIGCDKNYVRGSSARWNNNPLGFVSAD